MTQEEKQLLLKDLCSRLPYGVRCHYADKEEHTDMRLHRGNFHDIAIECVRPYLRPMSSMTKEEKYIYRHMLGATLNSEGESIMFVYEEDFSMVMDWLNKNHFDYRDLISMGLALEAPEGMYKEK